MLAIDAKTEEGRILAMALMEKAKIRYRDGFAKDWPNGMGRDIHGDFGGGEAFAGPWGISIRFDNMSDAELDSIGWTEPYLHSNRF